MKKKKPLILVSNDDGITSPGIAALIAVAMELGDVIVVAPDKPQSGMGHAITINQPIRITAVNLYDGVKAYQCTGTPVDCVKIAIDKLLTAKPDLMVSGVNHGSNASINVIYSGTMSAAVEASIDGIKAIGFSLCDYSWDANFEVVKPYMKQIMESVMKNNLPYGTLLNVNMPVPKMGEIKGIKICRQALAKWKESFDQRTDPFGRDYFWMTGNFINMDEGNDTDEWALKEGYISVVPTMFDLTDHRRIGLLNQWDL
ncbi:MAG: 5'/3'-nucleotidase SurE [Flavobacteriales bacterium]|nr:MAG: 5'/3'-nucleotidase SurE [Flavobacteriales bacterium]